MISSSEGASKLSHCNSILLFPLLRLPLLKRGELFAIVLGVHSEARLKWWDERVIVFLFDFFEWSLDGVFSELGDTIVTFLVTKWLVRLSSEALASP